jgi:type I restriction enzyme, S subunit
MVREWQIMCEKMAPNIELCKETSIIAQKEWIIGTVSDLASINPRTKTSRLQDDSLVSFLPMENVGGDGQVLEKEIRRLGDVRNGYTCFAEGDVLFAKITPCMENGKGAIALDLVNGIGYGSTEFHVIRPNESVDSGFIFHLTKSGKFRIQAKKYMTGSAGQQRVSSDIFFQHKIPIPSFPERRKIAAILSSVDEVIEMTEATIAKIKIINAGILHDLFTFGLDEHVHPRNPAIHPNEFKNSPVGLVPVEWDIGILDSIADSIDPQPDHRAPPEVPNGVPYIGVNDLSQDGSIDLASCRKVSNEALEKQKMRFCIEQGDILFGKIGSIGMPKILPPNQEYALNANTVLIKPKIKNSFVFWLLQSDYIEKQIKKQTHLTSQPAFGIQRIRSMKVSIPNEREQRRISAILNELSALLNSEENYLKSLNLMKRGLMQDLLTGRVRVKVDDHA